MGNYIFDILKTNALCVLFSFEVGLRTLKSLVSYFGMHMRRTRTNWLFL